MEKVSERTSQPLLARILDIDSEERYRSIVTAMSEGVVLQDAEGFIIMCNASAERILGLTHDQMAGRTSFDPRWRAIHEDGSPFPGEDHPAMVTLRTGEPQCDIVMGVHKPDETLTWISINSQPLCRPGEAMPCAVVTSFSDITERMRAEQALRESEERYRLLFDNSLDGILLTTPDGSILAANAAACQILGRTEEEIRQAGRAGLVDTSDPRLSAALEERARTGRFRGELSFVRGDGTRFPCEISSSVFEDPDGSLRTSMIIRDIAERKRAEAELREREAQYRSIFESVNDGLMINAMDGRIIEANPATCRMYGYTREELSSLDPKQLIQPDYRHLFTEFFETVGAGEQFEAETVNIRKDGTPFDVEVRGTPFIYKGEPHVLGIVRDITAHKQAENTLREQEALLRKILEILPVGVWILDRDGRVLSGNEAGQRIWAGARYVGMEEYDEYKGWWPDTGKLIEPGEWAAARAITRGETILEEVVSIEGFDGARKTILNSAVPVWDANGGLAGAIAVNQDVTEREQAYQLLEQRVQERTRELSALLEVSRSVASMLELRPLLSLILTQLKTVVEYTGAAIGIVEDGELKLVEYEGPLPREQMLEQRYPLDRDTGYGRVVSGSAPVIIDDIWADTPWLNWLQTQTSEATLKAFTPIHSWMGVPLIAKDRVIGVLRVDHTEPGYFTEAYARLVLAFADQAAVAIENARAFEQAGRVATLEERQRLARGLHDSISQALYAMALAARTARALLDRDSSKVAEPLDYLLSLAEAAFADMRALIFELQPESLENQGLVVAIARQVEVLRTRHGIKVEAWLGDEPAVPLGVKEALYRIAQEALHNIVKHARASRARLRLDCKGSDLILEVEDNGIGFDPAVSLPGHLGLRSMRERAEQLGGSFEANSSPGAGTCIRVQIPVPARGGTE